MNTLVGLLQNKSLINIVNFTTLWLKSHICFKAIAIYIPLTWNARAIIKNDPSSQSHSRGGNYIKVKKMFSKSFK